MAKRVLRFTESDSTTRPLSVTTSAPKISIEDFENFAADWLSDCEYRQHSAKTLDNRRIFLDRVLWFLKHHKCSAVGATELRQFFTYLTNGHNAPGGRWGSPRMTRPVRPRTVKDYHGHLRTFFRWLVAEGSIPCSPMEKLAAPVARADQVQPFTQEQVLALFQAARGSHHPLRDRAILFFLLDSGVRASELCSLNIRDVDLNGRHCTVLGKGNKHRTVYLGRNASRAVKQYLEKEKRNPDEPLFASERGTGTGSGLTYNGLRLLIHRLGRAANLQPKRCSPHIFRHTFAVEFLRAGGNVFTLKELLGHTTLHMTNRYVALAQADIQNQHRQFSPADHLKKRASRN